MKSILTKKEFLEQLRNNKDQFKNSEGGYDLNKVGGLVKERARKELLRDIIRNTKSW